MRIPHLAGPVLASLLWGAAAVAQDSAPAASGAARAGHPVVVGRDTVFQLRATVPPFSVEQRSLAISTGLSLAAERKDLRLDSLRLVPGRGYTLILADSVTLLAVHDADAAAEGVPRDTLAARWATRLQAAFSRRGETLEARALGLGIAETAAATLAFVLLTWLLLRLERRVEREARRWAEARVRTLDPQRARLVTPAMLANAATSAAGLLRLAGLLALGYTWLVVVFGAFSWTQPLAGRILRFVSDPLVRMARGAIDYLPSLIFIVVVVAVLRLLLRVIRTVFRGVEQGTLTFRNFPAEWADPTYKLVRSLAVAFGFVLIFPYLPGAGSDAFKAISLFAGALFSLGSSGAVANIVAGAVIVYTRAFRVGEFVRIGETEGMVVERSLLVTRIRTVTNVDVSIPSATVLGSHVQNFSAMARDGGLVVQSRVTIGYDVPWRRVHELLLDGARRTDGVLASPASFVVQESLNDYYPTYCLNVYTDRATGLEVFRLRSRLNENIQDAFFEGGVEILSPAYTSIRDGNRTAMPATYLPEGYVAPGFKVEQAKDRD